MWKEINKNLGTIYVGNTYIVEFEFDGITIEKDHWNRDYIETSCGCTSARVDYDNKKIIVEYRPGPVPVHMAKEGKTFYVTKKEVIVHYLEGPKFGLRQKLTFNATVKQK